VSILVAGIGNVFFGDDGFGVEVAQRLLRRALPADVTVRDFGIRGRDLAYTLLEKWDAAILVDATSRGGAPGTLYVLEPAIEDAHPSVEAHALDPVKVLALAKQMGSDIPCLRLVGCEPAALGSAEDPALGLSAVVEKAIDPAVTLVEELITALREVPRA
jgi:hydrogenase maturation protease